MIFKKSVFFKSPGNDRRLTAGGVVGSLGVYQRAGHYHNYFLFIRHETVNVLDGPRDPRGDGGRRAASRAASRSP